MKTIVEPREDLIKIIKKNNVEEFERYVKERDIVLKNLNNQGFDILIYTIENNISVDIIKSIIEQKQYKTYNYVINENSRQKVPLISAILNNNFEIADLLIKHNANINQFDIIYYLFKINRLNYQNLNYILYHGFHIRNITPYLINELIETNNNIILNKIFKYYLFSNEFILNFLKMYQDQNPVSLQHLQEVLRKEKKGIKVEGTMYDKALAKENYGAFKILFENDSGDEDNLLYKVNKYDLLEKAVKTNDINFVKTILRYDPFTFKSLSSKKILMAASRMKNINILKLLITMSLESYENEKALPSSLSSSSSSPSPSPSPSPSSSPSVKETNLKKNKYDVHYLNFIINIAIKMNDMNLVTFLMEDDEYKPYIDINTEDIHGEYPLITAFCYDHLDLFKYLISRGANCHIKSNGNTLLSMAIDDSDNTKYIKCLLKKKIDINEKDVNENYPLMKAIKKNNINIVILLVHYGLKHGVDMNVMDINGNTPLILSYRLEYYEIFKFLIKYLDINQRDSNGNSLLYYALLREDIETIEYLTGSGADVNIKFKSGGSALDLAISKGYRFIYALLHNKINIALNIPNEEGETPLISVIKSNDFTIEEKKRILQKLIKKGANVNFIDKEENTPLVYAIQMKSLPIIKLLIENGANINHLIKSSYITVLMEAIGLGEMDIVKYLVECNANINFKNEFGNTPLTYAISTNNDQMVKYLIDSGADVNNRNNQGQTLYNINRNYNYNNNNNSYTDIGKQINKLLGFIS
jgi:ankyrin repeat protein